METVFASVNLGAGGRQMDNLEWRVECLEKQSRVMRNANRRYKIWTLVLGLMLISVFSMAARPGDIPSELGAILVSPLASFRQLGKSLKPNAGMQSFAKEIKDPVVARKQSFGVLQAQELQIVNSRGNVVCVIGADAAGDGIVAVTNARGALVAGVAVTERGHGSVRVLNAEGTIVGVLEADENANGLLGVANSDGEVDEAGDGVLGVVNARNSGGSVLGIDDSGNGLLGVLNAGRTNGAGIGINESGNGSLRVTNQSGERVVDVTADTQGNGQITVKDRNGRNSWTSAASSSTPPSPGLLGDLDGDQDVDFNDFLLLASNFGKTAN